ncbi:MAG: triose-phosphate isomerase, partial [Rhodospirillales bacterium]|nr:triose-phosphate isomerase [Rhodospirillales bacterium]
GTALRVLYGGSVTARNAGEILTVPGVDGVLVGGASLSADAFWQICQSCA